MLCRGLSQKLRKAMQGVERSPYFGHLRITNFDQVSETFQVILQRFLFFLEKSWNKSVADLQVDDHVPLPTFWICPANSISHHFFCLAQILNLKPTGKPGIGASNSKACPGTHFRAESKKLARNKYVSSGNLAWIYPESSEEKTGTPAK